MSRPPRIPGFSYLGPYRYFLTFCALKRQEIFVTAPVVETVLVQFRKTAFAEAFAISAYGFMPDHVHLLVEGTRDNSDLRRFAKLSKQRSGAAHALTGAGRLWQEGYYEHVLREEDDERAIARYILENPVRAEMVASPLEYPYLGSDVRPLAQILEHVAW
jgi:putative transposase